jgi:ATPase subunit of ABC transporter with duplicated ATPase domains
VSHDRYLLERVTDNQYAVMNGGFTNLPRGVEQYLELRLAQQKEQARIAAGGPAEAPAKKTGLQGAELRNAQKELAAAGRKMEKLSTQIAEMDVAFAKHDQSDYSGLGEMQQKVQALRDQMDTVELRWLELTELLEG